MTEIEKRKERNWGEFDQDALSIIFIKVGAIDLLEHAQFVCKHWRNVSFNPSIWKVADFTTLKGDCMVEINLEKMTREAADRSKGQMEELWIEYFGSDDLLSYIADKTSILKRLRMISAYDINDEGLIDMLKRQPQLEELEITFGAFSNEIYKEIGKACPNLKCFRSNEKGRRSEPFQYDGNAIDIANNMPELRVLQLVGNSLTDKGLNEILDKCKHLESLDIRCCFAVDVHVESKAKAKKLREFRLPFDSTDDYEYVAEVEDDYNPYYYTSGCSDDEYIEYDDYTYDCYDGFHEAIMEEFRDDHVTYGGYENLFEAILEDLRDL